MRKMAKPASSSLEIFFMAEGEDSLFMTVLNQKHRQIQSNIVRAPGFSRVVHFVCLCTYVIALIAVTPLSLLANSSVQTWANWEKKCERAFADINPRKAPGRAMGIVVPADTRTDLLALSAFGYESLSHERLQTIIIIMPVQSNEGRKGILTTDRPDLETSLGRFTIDTTILDGLDKEALMVEIDNDFFSPKIPDILEQQLACLKFILKAKSPTIKILPLFVRFSDLSSDVKDVGSALADHLKDMGVEDSVSFIILANLSEAADEPKLVESDSHMLTHLRSIDIDGLLEHAPLNPTSHSLIFGMMILKWLNADHSEVLAYAHSGQLVLTVDRQKLTGYASVVVASGPPYPAKIPHVAREKLLGIFDELFRADLLNMTRQTCASILDPTAAKPPSMINREASKRWPVYVTLYDPEGNLAGQSGSHVAAGPLEETIRQYAFEAVQKAKPKISKETFAKYVVDISIPHGFQGVQQPDDLIPQLHGIIVEREHRKDSFHPDAWRTYPDPHQLLSAICTKLRLKPWAYATTNAKIESFRVLSFNEKEPFQDLGAATRKKKKKKSANDETFDEGSDTGGGGGGGFPF